MPNEYLEEEEDPLLQAQQLAVMANQQQAPGLAPAPSVQAPTPPRDALTDYLLKQQQSSDKNRAMLQSAEDTALLNRTNAKIGGAAAQLGGAIAGANNVSQAPFEELAKEANQPIANVQKQASLENGSNKLLQSYLLSQGKMGISKDSLEERKRHNNESEKIGNNKNDVLGNYFGKKIEQGQTRIDLSTGAQAAGAAKEFRTDPVIKVGDTQIQQIDKDLGRFADVDSGKVKFTTSLKSEIEKGIANVISGGTSSALGNVERIEFQPYVAKWQAVLDKLSGYQGDVEAPEFIAQLKATLNGLKSDIKGIQSARSQKLKKSMGTAYSKNPLATKAVEENTALYSEGGADDRVPMVNPSGESGMLRKDQVDAAVKAGWRKK